MEGSFGKDFRKSPETDAGIKWIGLREGISVKAMYWLDQLWNMEQKFGEGRGTITNGDGKEGIGGECKDHK